MRRIPYLVLSLLVAASSCQTTKKKKKSTAENQCNSENYEWIDGQCQFKGAKQAQKDCEAKGDGFSFVNNECVEKTAVLDEESECQKRQGATWQIDPTTKIGKCIDPKVLSPEEECASRTGFVWRDNVCITEEVNRCLNGGDQWFQDRCMPTAERDCLAKDDGSTWVDLHCASPSETGCQANPDKKWQAVDGTFKCTDKSFYDYCIDPKLSEEHQRTLDAVRSNSGINNEKSEAGCEQARKDLQARTYLNIANKGLTSLKILQEFRNLVEIYMDGNKFTNLKGLLPFVNLERINASTNELETIEDLGSLSKLKAITVNQNKLTHLRGLSKLRYLETLYAVDNPITDLNSFPLASDIAAGRLNALTTLGLGNNCKLTNVGGLFLLPALTDLDLTDIGISQTDWEQRFKPLFRPEISLSFNPCS